MDYYKIFNPNDEESDVYCIQSFFDKYPYFNSKEYKILNENIDPLLKSLNGINILVHYHLHGFKKNYICSIKHFYKLYPSFDIDFYKLFYEKELEIYKSHENNFQIQEIDLKQTNFNNIYYLIDFNNYIHKNEVNGRIISFNQFNNTYNIDYCFLKIFYREFNDKNEYDIMILLIKSMNKEHNFKKYILSDKDFIEMYPTFNLNLYKLLNSGKLPLYNNDIEYKSYWYHIGQYKSEIISINDVINNIIPGLNIDLYKIIYNINNHELDEKLIYNIYINQDNLIYSYDSFMRIIDDFNFILFIKHYPIIKNSTKEKIIEFYINNITKINNIYSEKLFYIKYPDFNLNEYRMFYNDKNESIKIYNQYNFNKNKDSVIISIKDFYTKYSSFNLVECKNILNKRKIIFSTDNEYIYYWFNNQNSTNLDYIINEFKTQNKDFDIDIYKLSNRIENTLGDYDIILDFINIKDKSTDLIYSIKSFYNVNTYFDKDIYSIFNNVEEYDEKTLICDFLQKYNNSSLELIYDTNTFLKKYTYFNLRLYKELNRDLSIMNDKELIIHWYKEGLKQNRIYSSELFYKIYPSLDFNINSPTYNFYNLNEVEYNMDEIQKILYWMNKGIYDYLKKSKDIVGRDNVNNIYEVLIDLEQEKPILKNGISLIIRAKNEELNLKYCIESVVDLVDEIIFVDNNSTDDTYKIMNDYAMKYSNIKLYKYNINVSKVGIEHEEALKTNNMNTLGTFYNWCLSKATRYNIFKWDADFICVRNNFKQLVELYDLKNRNDKFAIWFTGKTLFENIDKYYLNDKSFYNEYRIFSYKNGFKWYNGDTCEYTEPYITNCENKYKYIHPLFYEIKRTSIDEFMERSSMIDTRDINDFNILNRLKDNETNNKEKDIRVEGLIYIDKSILILNKKIIIFTPSLNFGGGNQFVMYMYNKLKTFGFYVKIVPLQKINKNSSLSSRFNSIVELDIEDNELFNIDYIKTFSPDYIIFNSSIPFEESDIKEISTLTKIIFVTHSDVAFSNYFIEKYNKYMYKIITVNIYTIRKLTNLLKINITSFFKLTNIFDDLHNNSNRENDYIKNNSLKKKTKKFGVISRFSEDKNIPMLIYSLVNVFKKYPDYKCYLVGTDNIYYDNYLKYLCDLLDVSKYISFEGYQDNVVRYYKMFDFIVLPSVSEGCSYNIIEAMSFGKPVIVSDVGGNHELIKENINGIIYPYTGIKDFESKTIYINNYNEQLSLIGYFKKSDIDKNYMNNNINFNNIEVNVPYFMTCKLCKNIMYNLNNRRKCIYCLNIKRKIEIFNANMMSITTSIIKIIEIDDISIDKISLNNIDFIKKNFNNDIYIRQILELFK